MLFWTKVQSFMYEMASIQFRTFKKKTMDFSESWSDVSGGVPGGLC